MCLMLIDAAEDLYPGDKEKQKEMVENHINFFNTSPTMTIVPGVVLGLEVEKAKGSDVPNMAVQSIKAALASPFAGIGDSIMQGMLIPILASIGMAMSANGSGIGGLFLAVAYCAIAYPLEYWLFKKGVTMGIDGADAITSSGLKNKIIEAITLVGCIVTGAVAATTLRISTKLTVVASGVETAVQDYLDKVWPGLLSILALFGVYWLMKNKKISALKMLGILLVVAALGYFLHIL